MWRTRALKSAALALGATLRGSRLRQARALKSAACRSDRSWGNSPGQPSGADQSAQVRSLSLRSLLGELSGTAVCGRPELSSPQPVAQISLLGICPAQPGAARGSPRKWCVNSRSEAPYSRAVARMTGVNKLPQMTNTEHKPQTLHRHVHLFHCNTCFIVGVCKDRHAKRACTVPHTLHSRHISLRQTRDAQV